MNIAHWLERTASDGGGRPAILQGYAQICDYAGFWRDAAGFAGWLRQGGIAPGDRVMIYMQNHPDYLIGVWGAWIAGAAVVPVNSRLHPSEAGWIAENAGARVALVSDKIGQELAGASDVARIAAASTDMSAARACDPLPVEPRLPGDLAWLFYTSGTTGRPKGVRITHGMLAAVSLGYLHDVDSVTECDAIYYGGPMSHGAGIYGPVHVLKGAAHIVPKSGGFDPRELLADTAAHGSASMFLAPTMVRRLTAFARDAGDRGAGIRTIVYGGGPMYVADLKAALDHFGPKFVQIYGQGESPMVITALSRDEIADRSHPDWEVRAAGVGRAQSTVAIAIAADDGTHLPPGVAGEILVRGLPVMPGYWQNPAATDTALKDGWLWTGDIGRLDRYGYLTLVDRSKDLIISGGSNVYPREVEETILTHPSVAEVAVVGRPHPGWGEEVVAFIVAEPGQKLDVQALEAHCIDRLGRYKRPKAWFETDALPKNNYGKVLKTDLRARLKIT